MLTARSNRVRISKGEKWFRSILFILSSSPGVYLVYQYYFDSLGVNPFAKLSHFTGTWAMIFLLLTLLITPLRRWLRSAAKLLSTQNGKRLSDWNYLIRARRQVGLFSFFYACLHCWVYLSLDIGWKLDYFTQDINERPFIILGVLGFAILSLLAMTSPKFIVKKLGSWWRKIHQLIYILVPIVIFHYWLVAKHDDQLPTYFALIGAVLLLYRFRLIWSLINNKSSDDGMEKFRD